MVEVLWLGVLLGVGAAFAVGPIFVTIVQEAATRGFGASLRVILGSATADLLLLLPALAFAWAIGLVAGASFWVGVIGAVVFLWLAAEAARDAWRLWRGEGDVVKPQGWAFWKGVLGNLANPLTWTFWLATGTLAMLRAQEIGGWPGLLTFTATWFVVASGLEAVVALVLARSRRPMGSRGQALFSVLSAAAFAALAAFLTVAYVLPKLGEAVSS